MIREAPTNRCAIYTRKSTEEGLDQDFNSLDAQRESGENYIASQTGEGWTCLPDRYDDGGFSGGTMERPALKRLMADIEAGKVDTVVVYKVDRLSRSLLDFARILEVFDKHSVSFVAVTQQINSASSMGRLMLNVLLSFAQFEREIISERTKDKIAAARRRGKWSGGHHLLGYDVVSNSSGSKLAVNEDEANQVRQVFDMYLKHEALVPVVAEISRRGWRTKAWTTKGGKARGGRAFDKCSLFKLLTNVAYLGKVTHGEKVYDGEHEAIVSADVFERVRRTLNRNGRTGGAMVRNRYGALLKDLLRCKRCGCSMGHTYSTKNGRARYRYYVCLNAQKRGWHTCETKSVPAEEIERFVVERLKVIGQDPNLLAATLAETQKQGREALEQLIAEQRSLNRQMKRTSTEIGKLVVETARKGPVSDRLADLNERLRIGECRLGEIREQMAAIGDDLVDESQVADALRSFDPVWNELSANEQCRIMRLLVQRVDYDGAAGTVAITFHPGGLRALANQRTEAAA